MEATLDGIRAAQATEGAGAPSAEGAYLLSDLWTGVLSTIGRGARDDQTQNPRVPSLEDCLAAFLVAQDSHAKNTGSKYYDGLAARTTSLIGNEGRERC